MRNPHSIGLLLAFAMTGGAFGHSRPQPGDWPQFRGPGGLGVSDQKGLPLTWSSIQNVAWKTALPGENNHCLPKPGVHCTMRNRCSWLLTTELTGQRDKPAEGESAFRKSMDELLPLLEKADLHLSVEPHPGDELAF
jgi:hypothetical protein